MNCNCRAYETLGETASTVAAGRPFRKLFSVGPPSARRRARRRQFFKTAKISAPAILVAVIAII